VRDHWLVPWLFIGGVLFGSVFVIWLLEVTS
jgi:hypothetical protein